MRLRAQRCCNAACSGATIASRLAARCPLRPRFGRQVSVWLPAVLTQPTNLLKKLRCATAKKIKAQCEATEMWGGGQVNVGLGGQVFGWTRSLRAVGSRMWVTQLSCEDVNARNDLQRASLLWSMAGSSDFSKEQCKALKDLAF